MAAPYDDGTQAAVVALTAAVVTCCVQDQTFYTAVQTHQMAIEQHNMDLLMELERHHEQIEIDNDNQISLQHCEQERTNRVDIASAILALATYAVYDRYYDKYKDVLDWRDEISMRIKDCLEQDIDHYIDVVMSQMEAAIGTLLASPRVSVAYQEIISRYCGYGDSAASAASSVMSRSNNENCLPCNDCGDDLEGWATMNAISAADDRVRFDEARVPRRLDLISGAVDSAHSSTFNLPSFDYQALSNAAQIASSLATAYAGIANSALGSFGYFSTNFVNSLN